MLQLHRLQSMVIRCIPLSQLAVALSQLVMQDGVASIQLQCVLKDISCSLVLPSLSQNTSFGVQVMKLCFGIQGIHEMGIKRMPPGGPQFD